jgi:hypothetical protein
MRPTSREAILLGCPLLLHMRIHERFDIGRPRTDLSEYEPAVDGIDPADLPTRDGFGSDTHGYECGCHYLPHFISNSNTNTNIIEYEYKTDISNSDSHSNTYSIYSIES